MSADYLGVTGTPCGVVTPRDLSSTPRVYCCRGEWVGTFGTRLDETMAAAY